MKRFLLSIATILSALGLSAQFNNEAELAPGLSIGVIDIAGPVVQVASGSKTIEVGGNNGAGVDPDGHDQVSMITDLTLTGTLDVTLSNSFDPSTGGLHGPYTIAKYSGDLSGTYTTVNWPTEMVDWGVDYGIVSPGEVVLFAKSDLTTVESMTCTRELWRYSVKAAKRPKIHFYV